MPLFTMAGGARGGSRSVLTPHATVLSRERVCPQPPGHGLGHPRPGQQRHIQATLPARGDLIAISISASIGFLLGLSFYVS